MPVSAVIYDSASVLPLNFVSDEGLGDSVVRVRDLADAHRLGRQREVLVIVVGDESDTIGLLTSFAGDRAHVVLLFLTDAQYQRRMIIHGARRGAAVMIGESFGVLAACLRDLVARPPFVGRATTYRATGSALSPAEVCLLRLAGRRAARRRDRHGGKAS